MRFFSFLFLSFFIIAGCQETSKNEKGSDNVTVAQIDEKVEPTKPEETELYEPVPPTDKTGDIQTKQNFGSIQLHIEWRSPAAIQGENQSRANSGVFLNNLYEVQVLEETLNPETIFPTFEKTL